ncbi:poly-beta-1,6-N-acetyl-D-glucosamine biosynthesis protein PgaD [Ectobacillus ponti]|uniref:Poly-beta-1,6-N-acetyl-D-glucosamine biosynthesis protein PgaD n=1 Tax=Ectobacillus ponti TaxID=2961894 RepID=A0AA41X321_9BACI|nr:poly-beta-1,6-N-acetyl-D-glucosamine biosynthesis protein PgaD [Ectobacillus ponti]MCP8968039.1 poly-beta-1,6-N-acetyl-D-glucosamine biosynthesis protein PgaD [Ectobacillus ponti]
MGKSGPGRDHVSLIVQHKRPLWIRVIELVITAAAWLYLIATATLLVSASFGIDASWKDVVLVVFHVDEKDIRNLVILLGFFLGAAALGQWIWSGYNYTKYGSLRRRKFPISVESGEIADFFSLSEEEVRRMQEEQVIILKERIF